MLMQEANENNFPDPVESDLPITPGKAGLIVFFSILLFMIIGVVGRLIAEAVWGPLDWKSPFMVVEIFIIIPAVLVIKSYRYPLKAAFRLNPISVDIVVWSFFAGISLAILGDQLDRIVQTWYPMPAELLEQLELTFKTKYTLDFISLFLIGTLGAGVCEEVLFRGFFQRILEKRMHLFAAIALPAVLFGIIHVLPWLIFQITVMGVVLGIIAWKTNSVYPTIIIHAVNNAIAILFLKYANPEVESMYLSNEFVDPKIVLVCIGIFIFALTRIWKKNPAVDVHENKP